MHGLPRTSTSLSTKLTGALRRIALASSEGVTQLSITYPDVIRSDRVDRVMTQFHYLLRTGSASAVWRTEDSVMFEVAGHMEMSARDVLSSVAGGAIIATTRHDGDSVELRVELDLTWMSVAVPGVLASLYWWVTRYHVASATPVQIYLPVLIGPVILNFLIRRQVARAWQRWLEKGIDETYETARTRYNARRERK